MPDSAIASRTATSNEDEKKLRIETRTDDVRLHYQYTILNHCRTQRAITQINSNCRKVTFWHSNHQTLYFKQSKYMSPRLEGKIPQQKLNHVRNLTRSTCRILVMPAFLYHIALELSNSSIQAVRRHHVAGSEQITMRAKQLENVVIVAAQHNLRTESIKSSRNARSHNCTSQDQRHEPINTLTTFNAEFPHLTRLDSDQLATKITVHQELLHGNSNELRKFRNIHITFPLMDTRQIKQLTGSHQQTVNEDADLTVTMKPVISPALTQSLKIEVI